MWVADVGDDQLERATAAVHKVPAGGTKAIKFRLQYPDGKHNSAALIMQANGVPVIITKEAGTVAKLYTTAAPLTDAGTVPLIAAGTLAVPASTTSGGPVGPGGRTVVTGATLSPDGKKVLVRTYTDAYEYDVNADVPAALKGKPRHTPLPDEAGRRGDHLHQRRPELRHPLRPGTEPAAGVDPGRPAGARPPGSKAGGKKADSGGGFSFSDLSLQQLGGVVLGVGALGLILLVVGIVGIVRFRKQGADDEEPEVERRPGGPRPGGAPATAAGAGDGPGETVLFPRTAPSVYGSGAASAARARTGGAGAGVGAGGKPSGTVYGGGGGGGARATEPAAAAAPPCTAAPSEPPADVATARPGPQAGRTRAERTRRHGLRRGGGAARRTARAPRVAVSPSLRPIRGPARPVRSGRPHSPRRR